MTNEELLKKMKDDMKMRNFFFLFLFTNLPTNDRIIIEKYIDRGKI